SVAGLAKQLSPDFDLTANPWLFHHFTSALDHSLLRTLNHGLDFIGSKNSFSININLSTALSPAFTKFDERLPAVARGHVVLEIHISDLMEHFNLYRELLDIANRGEYRICIDGLNEFWASQIDFNSFGCDYAKMYWSSAMAAQEPDMERAFLNVIA